MSANDYERLEQGHSRSVRWARPTTRPPISAAGRHLDALGWMGVGFPLPSELTGWDRRTRSGPELPAYVR
ncbi:hypothetical protein [Cryptosporangium arvum]|uniref:Uncharacterized protein n=1 Tax=Cryptosporangium arvum DSM 44712 TaxID=927661 RepID=A0A010YQF3_9ACTN|nr:hypothetical protein [Cryptosporangium arvum]EXG82425.1 hypothetical protein CryarDRAFT_3609 [Cryptosporangium arvum DSM 44712]